MQAAFYFETAAPQGIGDVDQDFIGFERLDDVPEGAHVERRVGQQGTVQARDHDGGGVRMLPEGVADQVHARFPGHIHVA